MGDASLWIKFQSSSLERERERNLHVVIKSRLSHSALLSLSLLRITCPSHRYEGFPCRDTEWRQTRYMRLVERKREYIKTKLSSCSPEKTWACKRGTGKGAHVSIPLRSKYTWKVEGLLFIRRGVNRRKISYVGDDAEQQQPLLFKEVLIARMFILRKTAGK